MYFGELIDHLQTVGKDPSRLIFEDELTGLYNRRFLLSFFEHKVRWDLDESFPLSLLFMDVDLFKAINDAYGHQAGDEALVFVAALLREAAGDRGHAVRYGGDEFVLLLPGADLETAVDCAHRLHRLTKERTLRLSNGRGSIGLCLSIGVASARADAANAQELLRKADTALYASKKLGRNRVSIAAEVDPEKTFSRTALHRLRDARVAGRERELARVSEHLAALQLGESRFLLIEGAPGLGKSTLLEAVARGLANADGHHVVRGSGRIQEGFRPYYLIGELLLTLLRTRPDGADDPISSLTKDEVDYVSHVLPQLPSGLAEETGDDRGRREGIFVTLVQIITRLVSGKPLVLLIDDLQYADEGSLMLLRLLFARKEIALFVCGTTTETVAPAEDGGKAPWEAFRATYGHEIPLEELRLAPLRPGDIVRHVSAVFPGIDLPEGFGEEIGRLTQGNPLFLDEILRKLVTDQKLVLEGQRWKVKPFDAEYLPRSLEEVVAQEIEELDSDARTLLEQVSAMGENVSLSQLTGAAAVSESRVLEFLDHAEARGLLRAGFHLNDETMRFLGKRVLEIVYGSIDGERKREIHGLVGSYHEELHRQGLGASASILAYHFKRSTDREKASRYDRLRRELHQRTFDREEADHYSGDAVLEEDEADSEGERPSPEALERLPNLFRALLTCVRNVQLYPRESQPVQKGFRAAHEAAGRLLESASRMRLSRSRGALLANGFKVDVSEFRLLARSYLELLERCELEAIELRSGVAESELQALFEELGGAGSGTEPIAPGHWREFASSRGLSGIALEQTRYSEIRRRRAGRAAVPESGAPLGEGELVWVPRILRAFTGAAKNIQLYPLGSGPVIQSLSQLETALAGLLRLRALVTFSAADGALIVNGARIGTSGFEALAERFLLILQEAELTSVTFRETVTRGELEIFVQGLEDGTKGATDAAFWTELAERKGLTGIVLNDRRYTSGLLETLFEDGEEGAGGAEEEDAAEVLEPASDDIPLTDALPTVGKALLEHGEDARLSQLLTKLFRSYDERDEDARDDLLRGCRLLMDSLVQAHQHRLAERAVDYWLFALREETEPSRLRDLAGLLHRAATVALTFGDTTTASRAWAGVRERNRELLQESEEDRTPPGRGSGAARGMLAMEPEPSAKELLLEELRSSDPARRESAAQVLESLGDPSIPILIAVIKRERDYRTRRLAASLLARIGDEAARGVKRELMLEITIEQRCRLLEVIDVVTRDLEKELAFCLSDVHPRVRRSAFRLSERLGGKPVVELLVDLAHHADIDIAKGAMRSLASLRSPHAVGALSAALGVTKDPERVIAIVQALAQLADAGAVPSLRRLLIERRVWRFGSYRWSEQVRATAAFALAQIDGDAARAALEELREDADPRIRGIAKARERAGSSAVSAPGSASAGEEGDQKKQHDQG